MNPEGKAILQPARWVPPHEPPGDERPLRLMTGRTVYHFHTRTKTGRTPELQAAAPDVWVELAPADAAVRGIDEGDVVEVRSARGVVRAPARISGVRDGAVFVPFHYGSWDLPEDDDRAQARAANELTLTSWDPVSKQPLFKAGAVQVVKVADGTGRAPAPDLAASAPMEAVR